MLKLKNWHYLSYKGHFCLCVQRKTNAFQDVYGRFGSFKRNRRVVTCYNWVRAMRQRLRPVCRYVLTIISVKILHKSDETSLRVTRIAVSLTLE